MNVISYRIIEKIAQTGSLTRTAEFFNYSQSRVSQVLKAAEEEIGFSLFIRTRAGAVPTAECQSLLPMIQDLIRQENALSEQIHQLKQVQSGVIRIGSFTSLSCHWLPSRLKPFGEQYPGISYELKLGDHRQICDSIRAGVLDFGLITEPESPEFHFLPLLEDHFSVILPPEHPLAQESTLSLMQLQGERLILLAPEDNGPVEDLIHQVPFCPTIPYRVKDDYTIMSMVESGLGISILPHLVINRAPYQIREVPLSPIHSRTMGIVFAAGAPLSAAAGKLLDYLLNDFHP